MPTSFYGKPETPKMGIFFFPKLLLISVHKMWFYQQNVVGKCYRLSEPYTVNYFVE